MAISYEPKVDKAVVSAVRTAFQRSLTSPRNWLAHQSAGRIDTRNVWRNAATGDRAIFRERLAPGASKVNVHILVDGSHSMDSRDDKSSSTSRIQHAADITATLCDAFRAQATVRFNVWLHNSHGEKLNVYPVVTNGQGRERIGRMVERTNGGNGDGYILHWMGEKLRRTHRHGEVDLVIVVSDGLPSWVWSQHTHEGTFQAHMDGAESPLTLKRRNAVALMFNEVESLRDAGVQVLSVAIAPNPNQVEMFGEAGVIPFTGDWNALAVSFGSALGRTLREAGEHKRGSRR